MQEVPEQSGWKGALQECLDVLLLVSAWSAPQFDAAEYKLIAVQNLYTSGEGHLWRVTLKPRSLFPAHPGEATGAGGELFLQVDLEHRTVTIAGFGE